MTVQSLEIDQNNRRPHLSAVNPSVPFNPKRSSLYSRDELMEGFDGRDAATSLDQRIQVYLDDWKRQRPRDLEQGLMQREHDYWIEVALQDLIDPPDAPAKKIVGIMGSHKTRRDDPYYREVARLGWLLTPPNGSYVVLTGGGLGMMEAASLGAYLAPYGQETIDEVIEILGDHDDARYINAAGELRRRFPDHGDALAVPTWSYSNEPISQFSSHIAKHFENSSREEGLLAVTIHGVVFAPGAAGTLQEVFQDAAQNSYWSFNWRSPMVFLGRKYFTEDFPAYQLLMARAEADGYADMVAIFDTAEEVVDFLAACPPRPRPEPDPPRRTLGRSGPPWPRR
ncbi:MAG TPA: Rossmann fold nucleotide-binding protein [Actinomycetota bacterium]|nr:Rossmann fold nucleotide-binding protein [Actinomycetota bacterium]